MFGNEMELNVEWIRNVQLALPQTLPHMSAQYHGVRSLTVVQTSGGSVGGIRDLSPLIESFLSLQFLSYTTLIRPGRIDTMTSRVACKRAHASGGWKDLGRISANVHIIRSLALQRSIRRIDIGVLGIEDLTRFQSVISEVRPTHLSLTLQTRNWTNVAVPTVLRTAWRLTHLVLTVDISTDLVTEDVLDSPLALHAMLSAAASLTFLDIRFKCLLASESVAKHPRIQAVIDNLDMEKQAQRCARHVPSLRFIAGEFFRSREFFVIAESEGKASKVLTWLDEHTGNKFLREEWRR
ncbi:hypothetical protein OBBRIDRAFT_329206 [Obba rivulosa]|uniref:Uncharacterized protein n=1 Tax=Obba rivulosa TaxID=1052685 RepID=A0A8E2AIN1_9APHY|nr:hypothetical protein OBBRIDRAFT_329206 [Obba rivulosa]